MLVCVVVWWRHDYSCHASTKKIVYNTGWNLKQNRALSENEAVNLSIQTWWISGTGSNPPQSEFLSKCCAQCNYKHDIAVDVSSTNPQIWLLCLLKLQARSWSSANIAALIFPWIPKATALILKVRRLKAAVLKLAVKRPRPFIVPATSPTQLHQLHFVILLLCLCLLCHISHFSHLGRLYKHSLEHLVPVQHSRGCGNVSTSPQV